MGVDVVVVRAMSHSLTRLLTSEPPPLFEPMRSSASEWMRSVTGSSRFRQLAVGRSKATSSTDERVVARPKFNRKRP